MDKKVRIEFEGGPADGLALDSDFRPDQIFQDPSVQSRSQLAMAYYDIVKRDKRCQLHPYFVPGWLTDEQRGAFTDHLPLRMHVYHYKTSQIDGDKEVITLGHEGQCQSEGSST